MALPGEDCAPLSPRLEPVQTPWPPSTRDQWPFGHSLQLPGTGLTLRVRLPPLQQALRPGGKQEEHAALRNREKTAGRLLQQSGADSFSGLLRNSAQTCWHQTILICSLGGRTSKVEVSTRLHLPHRLPGRLRPWPPPASVGIRHSSASLQSPIPSSHRRLLRVCVSSSSVNYPMCASHRALAIGFRAHTDSPE